MVMYYCDYVKWLNVLPLSSQNTKIGFDSHLSRTNMLFHVFETEGFNNYEHHWNVSFSVGEYLHVVHLGTSIPWCNNDMTNIWFITQKSESSLLRHSTMNKFKQITLKVRSKWERNSYFISIIDQIDSFSKASITQLNLMKVCLLLLSL